MLRNKIPLCSFIGLILIATSLFAFSMSFSIWSNVEQTFDGEGFAGAMIFLLTGAVLIVSGIAFVQKRKWARIVANVILLITGVLILTGIGYYLSEMNLRTLFQMHLIEFATLLFLFCSILGFMLMLNNSKVVEELEEQSIS